MSRTFERRATASWALYDFANSAFTTLVVTFVYAAYFTQRMAADEIEGTALWSRGVTVTAVLVAVASPFLGALADRRVDPAPLIEETFALADGVRALERASERGVAKVLLDPSRA